MDRGKLGQVCGVRESGKIVSELEERLVEWQGAGLITRDQAAAIAAFEGQAERRRVLPREIAVYVGGFFVLMGVGFGLQVLWEDLGSVARTTVVAVPTLLLWGIGEGMRRLGTPELLRGAKACWMVGSWLVAILVAVVLHEWAGFDAEDPWLLVWASLVAVPPSLLALLILRGLPQGLAAGVIGAMVGFGLNGVVAEPWGWPEALWKIYLPWFVLGGAGLAAAEAARRRGEGGLAWLFNLFGAWSWLFWAFIIGQEGKLVGWETLLLVESVAIIAWSVARQSQVLLYSGGLFFLVYVANLNFEYFSDQLGLPIALLLTGVALVGVGLGVDRLRRLWTRPAS